MSSFIDKIKPKKKDLCFNDMESLKPVVNVVNEIAIALKDKKRTYVDSPLNEVICGALGAGIGGAGSFAALYALGTVGLSAAGITSGLAAAGALIGGGMVSGIFVLAAPIVILSGTGIYAASKIKNKQLNQEKNRLYAEALRKHEALIVELKSEVAEDKERIDYLKGLNILLERAILDLEKDLGVKI